MTTHTELGPGDKALTLEGDIDGNRYNGAVGIVQGFARLSSYHPREVCLKFEDGSVAWFWERRVCAPPPPHHSHKFLSAYPDSFAA